MWIVLPLLALAGCAISYRYERSVSVRRSDGEFELNASGTCSTNAEAEAETDAQIRNVCEGTFVETSRNANAYQCINGNFQSLLKGRCQR